MGQVLFQELRLTGSVTSPGGWAAEIVLSSGVGETTGRSRADRHRTLQVPVKELYVRPLRPDFRAALCA